MGHEMLLSMEGISKAFPGVQALERVSFDLRRGEVHALVGENGAGKSTLMKVLAGVYRADEGRIVLRGEPVAIESPHEAQAAGISIVHQELVLFPTLTVAENILAGQEPTRVRGLALVDRGCLYERARHYLRFFNSTISPKAIMGRLSVAQQQIVEICKALSLQAEILILDEPTSSLSESEAEQLFEVIRQLRDQGIGIIYISHRLKEVIRLADRVTVLRDGAKVGTLAGESIATPTIINMMVGRELSDFYGRSQATGGAREILLEVRGLSGTRFENISLAVYRGEIVGLTGLVGAGRSEVGLTIFGHLPLREGEMRLDGRPYHPRHSAEAIAAGVAYVPEDRRKYGLFYSMSVGRNLTVTQLDRLDSNGVMNPAKERRLATSLIERLGIRTPSINQPVLHLSGGNQQKTMLGKWLAGDPRLLIVDEPTRGVDVGAKVEIYGTLRRLAASGLAILMISSEMPEVIGMCERVYVMHEGSLQGELVGEAIVEKNIMTLASGHALGEAVRR